MKLRVSPRRVNLVAAFVIGLSVVACSSESSPQATDTPVEVDQIEIVKGVPDRDRDPAVVAIDIGDQGLCTGALIAPNVVLTAHHCVAQTTETVSCPPTGRQVGPARPPSSLQILVGDEAAKAHVAAVGKEIITPHGSSLCDQDIALVVLDREIPDVVPLDVREQGVAVGDHVRSVGFGRAGDGKAAGTKLLREHVKVLKATSTEFEVGEATCQGDSGGPALDEATGEIVGVVSRGGPTCDGKDAVNIYTRTDAFLTLVDEALQRAGASKDGPPQDAGASRHKGKDAGAKHGSGHGGHGKPPSDLGATCTKATDCSAGVCLSEHGKQYCSRPCDTHDRCPAHFKCTKATSGASDCAED